MRTLKELPVPQVGDPVKFPDGQIRNETDTELGTPVVRELYGDILVNIYKIIRDAGITFTETEDSETTQYQLLNALKVFSNSLNDIEQLVTVNANQINLGINFDNLPNKYLFIGRLSDALLSSVSYTINSGNSGTDSFPVNTTANIAASSLVLVILSNAGTNIVSLASIASSSTSELLNVSFGNPLSFNDSEEMLYFSAGRILKDRPESYAIEQLIQASQGTSDVILLECVAFKGKLLCFSFETTELKYFLDVFDLDNLNAIEASIDIPVDDGLVDNQPYMFCDGVYLYFTNSGAEINDNVNDFNIGKFAFDEVNLTLTAVSSLTLNNVFEKTTNTFMSATNQRLFTFINGTLLYYDLGGSSSPTEAGFFNTTNGIVFKFNGDTYYTNGEVARKWNY